jgi:uncharacterized protein DUF3592
MFGKRKILKNGAKAQAVIRSAEMSGLSNSHGAHKWRLELRVQFDDGTTVDASCRAWEVNIASGYGPGQIVPVRYDPEDRSKVELDHDALKAQSEARKEAGRAGLVKLAEEKLAGEPPAPSGGT